MKGRKALPFSKGHHRFSIYTEERKEKRSIFFFSLRNIFPFSSSQWRFLSWHHGKDNAWGRPEVSVNGGSTGWTTSVCASQRWKGDYGFNVFHNSNPQHGGSYARHERRMRDEEVEDFLKSVKGWVPVWSDSSSSCSSIFPSSFSSCASTSKSPTSSTDPSRPTTTTTTTTPLTPTDLPPDPSPIQYGDEAIMKTFRFAEYTEAYQFMGRLWAFCYGSDKYPHVVWKEREITVYLYSPSFKGISKREARVAAFLNDQFNMLKKSVIQRERVQDKIVQNATVEEIMGETVRRALEAKEARRGAPVEEMMRGPRRWEELIVDKEKKEEEKDEKEETDTHTHTYIDR